jgi:hypothetical protein
MIVRSIVRRVILFLAAGGSLAAEQIYNGPPPKFGPPPRVSISLAELTALKTSPEFPAQRDAAIAAAKPLLENPLPFPDGYGGWVFDYACPDDGTPLRAITPKEHECPKCKKRYSGEREVVAYRGRMHHNLDSASYDLAWAYALGGNEKFAEEVKRILLKLADDYATYPGRRDRWGHTGWLAPLGGRRYVQSLDEAVGAIELAKAYDLTNQAGSWSDAERKHVEVDFFRATADSLLRFTQPHNHQTWYNAGLVAIASALGDGDLLMKIITMNRGVLHQLENNVGSDGLWNEGTMAYHNYALQPLIQTADMTRRLGMNLHEHPRLRAMILAPFHAAYPNGQFPAINDSDRADIHMIDWAIAWAEKTYGERSGVASLKLRSESLADVGLAILRMGEGTNAVCTFLDYGPHGGGHGHFDKLNLMLYANGREWLLDPGRLTYSHKEYHTWVKTTAAHNTITLDGRSQAATTGKLLWLKEGEGWAGCAAECGDAYEAAVLRRYLLLTPTFLIDVCDVNAARATQIDWFAHALSDRLIAVDGLEGKPKSPGSADGYQHLSDGLAYQVKPVTRWDFIAGKNVLRLWVTGPEAEEIFSANGIGYTVDQKVPCLIRRQVAARARFVTVFDLTNNGRVINRLQAESNAEREPVVKLETAQGNWRIQFDQKGAAVEIKR